MMTLMEQEARQTPDIVATQLEQNHKRFKALIQRLEKRPPRFVITIGRGSSDHACTFAKYLFETRCGLVTASVGPSVITLYQSLLQVKDALVIGISQSGMSPDICEVMQYARRHGATTVAIVNQDESPLADAAGFHIPMLAGPEQAVAATKSYIASLATLVQLIAYYTEDKALIRNLGQMPQSLTNALKLDWSNAIREFTDITNTLVIARGYGFPVAQEAALKFKETASIYAEAFSSAELLHGPFVLIKPDRPFLIFAQRDESLPGIFKLVKKIKKQGARLIFALSENHNAKEQLTLEDTLLLALPKTLHPVCDPIMAIQAFYPMVAKLAVQRGFDPDNPENLQKVTETL